VLERSPSIRLRSAWPPYLGLPIADATEGGAEITRTAAEIFRLTGHLDSQEKLWLRDRLIVVVLDEA